MELKYLDETLLLEIPEAEERVGYLKVWRERNPGKREFVFSPEYSRDAMRQVFCFLSGNRCHVSDEAHVIMDAYEIPHGPGKISEKNVFELMRLRKKIGGSPYDEVLYVVKHPELIDKIPADLINAELIMALPPQRRFEVVVKSMNKDYLDFLHADVLSPHEILELIDMCKEDKLTVFLLKNLLWEMKESASLG